MALFLRYGVTAVALFMLLFCMSCEKHPLGQMPEVQREQSDPAAKVWSEKSETDKSEASPKPAEAAGHESR
jgi:uncharacterized protein YcfL